jgi:hypothetical protein
MEFSFIVGNNVVKIRELSPKHNKIKGHEPFSYYI